MRVRQPETAQEYSLDGPPLGSGGEANIHAVVAPTKSAVPDVHNIVHKHEGGAGKP